MMQNSKIKTIAFTGMFGALIFIATYSVKAPIGVNGGYIHFGDALVYAAAAMLPTPFAMLAAAIGAGFSDLMSGAAVWMLPTVIIKSLCCLPFTRGSEKMLCKRNMLAMLIAAAITMIGYGLATWVIAGSLAVAIAEAPMSLVQSAGSAICFTVLAAAFDRTKLRNAIGLN